MTISRSTPLLPVSLLFISLGCGDGTSGEPGADAPSGEPPGGSDTSAAVSDPASETNTIDGAGAPATRLVLPGLFSIMAGLEGAMAELDRGLWAERFDTIQAGARAVADHPAIPADEAERIRSVLGDDMARFQELDRTVHDLAVRIAEGAEREAFGAVMDAQADLRRGCVTCHSEFRERLRQGLR